MQVCFYLSLNKCLFLLKISLNEWFFSKCVNNDVLSSRVSDFTVGEYTFEIGGRKKGNKQIEDVPNGIVVKDDIEYGFLNVVPLWAFGLNYWVR